MFVEEFAFLVAVVALVQRGGLEYCGASGIAEREEARHDKADEHTGERGERDLAHPPGCDEHGDEQEQRVEHRCQT